MNLLILEEGVSLILTLGDAAGTQLTWHAAYAEQTSGAVTPHGAQGESNDTTAVEMVAAPAAGAHRLIRSIVVYNGDAAAHDVYVLLDTGTPQLPLWKFTLAAGETWGLSVGGLVTT